ncbi:MAG: lipoprotein [Bacteroidetes bacterium]|jgi:hypothetical protein|nr:lipoprotein [Bacteroidota bacterium]
MPLQRRARYSRRRFLKDAALLAAVLPLGPRCASAFLNNAPDRNEEIVCQKFQLAADPSLQGKTVGDVMAAIGLSFIGTPYVAQTLEVPGPEHLVVNLQGLDCTTFVENTLALSRCVKLNEPTFEAYTKQLQLIRYRSGVIQGYPSRLHYFTDWIGDNELKEIVRDITRDLGGVPLVKAIDFMSTHRKSYRQLSEKSVVDAISAAELRLSSAVHSYVPKGDVAGMQDKLRSGDIIAITTSIPGLDVSHTGLVVEQEGMPYYLHAPLSGGAVQLSKATLASYLAGAGKQTGIIVARPVEPGGH